MLEADSTLGDQMILLKKDILSMRKVLTVLGTHPHSEWMTLQLGLHEEFSCHQSALLSILKLGDSADDQLNGDPKAACFEAFSRVFSVMRTMLQKVQKLETAMVMSVAVAEKEGADSDAQKKLSEAFFSKSCTERYAKILQEKRGFLDARCQAMAADLSSKIQNLANSMKGLHNGGDACWKTGLQSDDTLKNIVEFGDQKFKAIDGAEVKGATQELHAV